MRFLTFFLFLGLVCSARATTVYLSGTLDSGGTLSDGTFFGSFDMDFPVSDGETDLSTFDITVQTSTNSFELDSNQSEVAGQFYGPDVIGEPAVLVEFFDENSFNFIGLLFDRLREMAPLC